MIKVRHDIKCDKENKIHKRERERIERLTDGDGT